MYMTIDGVCTHKSFLIIFYQTACYRYYFLSSFHYSYKLLCFDKVCSYIVHKRLILSKKMITT